jgi:hypothetical protein
VKIFLSLYNKIWKNLKMNLPWPQQAIKEEEEGGRNLTAKKGSPAKQLAKDALGTMRRR